MTLTIPRSLGGTLILGGTSSGSSSAILTIPRSLGGTLIISVPSSSGGSSGSGGFSLPSPSPTLGAFASPGGGEVVPLLFPPSLVAPYAVGGVPLPEQPYLLTAPQVKGTCVPAGATFFLAWSNPSSTTRALLANGTTVSLTFPLFNGALVTGPVALLVTTSGTNYLVSCTLTQTLTFNVWVVQTQFL